LVDDFYKHMKKEQELLNISHKESVRQKRERKKKEKEKNKNTSGNGGGEQIGLVKNAKTSTLDQS